ncbi:MAG: ATP-binding protein [Thaumarchaeota archaeon]|jgi:DNA helicase HerA-like ATPase|nr:ATP-binding protein [Candidatus Geocrenenecus arthurdayi]MCL7389855.1 ATP-binding protein [Candidatus Geocrenenecus arthurdayi]MCL7390606.1 ATP-binding protein [Candidatus Geocrenenecus arthurdayi]MCL7395859.1 ATP-binding protein [Candidatus Geocrenenecus arthurdayi]MCL7401739.1 ATP-binding protein [Candidatus Geocrenenecus arthurdayi]
MPIPIGIICSGASESSATVVLYDGMEKEVKNESLVLIKNKNGGSVLAVCRGGLGINESLRTGTFTPGVAYAKSRRIPSSVKEYFLFKLQVIGEINDNGISQNRIIIAPTSTVEIFTDEDSPMQYLGKSELSIGHYWGKPNWKVPVLKEYINYHIGVFGVTGSGKSYLTRYEIIPLLRRAGYDVIVMDWKGSDYAPYFESTITLDQIKVDNQTVVKYFGTITRNFGYYDREENPVAAAVETALRQVDWRGKDPAVSRELILQKARQIIMGSPGVKEDTKTLQLNRLESSFETITEEEFERFIGVIEPWEIVAKVKDRGIVIIDMSKGIKEQKLAVFTAITKYLKKLMERKQTLNIALVIDEGPQYAPWQPRGMERDTTDMIIDLCALGRSYGLSIVILSQGMAGEIGLNAAVRRNLNTQFIGRIHPLDVEEAQKLSASYYISPETLLTLPEGHFYFLGRMNPSPIPLLISFQIQ